MLAESARRFAVLSVALALVLSFPLMGWIYARHSSAAFEIDLRTSGHGEAQLYWDTGEGLSEASSRRVSLVRSDAPVRYRFALPDGSYRSLRFDPPEAELTLEITRARLIDSEGSTVFELPPKSFRPMKAITKFDADERRAVLSTSADDPMLEVVAPPFTLPRRLLSLGLGMVAAVLLVAFACFIVLTLLEQAARRVSRTSDCLFDIVASWATRRPIAAVALAALVAVVASTYPVVFAGRSFVSPNNGGSPLLYGGTPALPEITEREVEDTRFADAGALLWSHVPYGQVTRRAVLQDGELPLWNRYASNGATLVGQGQAMLGDPAQWLVVLADGAAWAWDLKFLIAKFLFCFGLGLAVLTAGGQLVPALLTALSASFIGFFSYRLNHPAIISVCYSPWILVGALTIARARNHARAVLGAAILVVANHLVVNSGTVKEAYMLVAFLNLAGALVVAGAEQPWRTKGHRLKVFAGAEILTVAVSAPFVLLFLDALRQSHTSYDVPSALQQRLHELAGFFDDAFYRHASTRAPLSLPSANFFILSGLLWSLARWRESLSHRVYLALGATALLPLGLAFGLVPPALVFRIPFLRNVSHLHNTFSAVLLVIVIVMAGIGLAEWWKRGSEARGRLVAVAALLLVGICLANAGSTTGGRFFAGYVALLCAAVAAWPWATERWRTESRSWHRQLYASLALLAFSLFHVRHGLHTETPGLDGQVLNPRARADFHARSPGLEHLRRVTGDPNAPSRAVGFDDYLFPGFGAYLGIESPFSCDPLINRRYREFMDAGGFVRHLDWHYVVTTTGLGEVQSLLDAMNVRYYAGNRFDPEPMRKLPTVDTEDLRIYESPTAWPRAFFVTGVTAYSDAAELVRMLKAAPPGRPFAAVSRQVLLERPELAAWVRESRPETAATTATRFRLTSNATSFVIETPGPGIVVLSEAWLDDHIRTTIDGKVAEGFPVNHMFRGMVVDRAGAHEIRSEYRPPVLNRALSGAVLGWIALGLWVAG